MTIPAESISVEITRLRGEMTTGFAKIGGQLDLIAAAQTATAKDVAELDSRVSALEARRVPLGLVTTVSGTASAVVAAAAFLLSK